MSKIVRVYFNNPNNKQEDYTDFVMGEKHENIISIEILENVPSKLVSLKHFKLAEE